jgi:hypothetical protein
MINEDEHKKQEKEKVKEMEMEGFIVFYAAFCKA